MRNVNDEVCSRVRPRRPLARFKSAAVVSDYIDTRRQENAEDTTIDKEVILLRAALRLAKEFRLWNEALEAGPAGSVISPSHADVLTNVARSIASVRKNNCT